MVEEIGMSEKLKIGVAGASGRMGQMLIKSLILDDRFLLAGVLENSGHDWLGLDVGEMTGGKSFGLSVSDDPLEVFSKIQAFIDFTTPSASTRYAHFAAQARCVHVIGTTGFSEKHFQKLEEIQNRAGLSFAERTELQRQEWETFTHKSQVLFNYMQILKFEENILMKKLAEYRRELT